MVVPMRMAADHEAAIREVRPRWTPATVALTGYFVLFAASQLALEGDILILPPVLIFAALDHAIAIALVSCAVALADLIRHRTLFSYAVLLAWVALLCHPLVRN